MTGELAVLAENPGHVYGWLWGADGELFARTLTEEGDFALSRWNATAGELALIITFAWSVLTWPPERKPKSTATRPWTSTGPGAPSPVCRRR
ncbi:hypothetical protein ACWHA1_35225 [Streptomyces decoyicus]